MQFLYVFAAVALIVVGLALAISPFPMGAVLAVGGLSMLLAVSSRARAWMRWERARHPGLDRTLAKAEEESPDVIAGPLERTDADAARRYHEEQAEESEAEAAGNGR